MYNRKRQTWFRPRCQTVKIFSTYHRFVSVFLELDKTDSRHVVHFNVWLVNLGVTVRKLRSRRRRHSDRVLSVDFVGDDIVSKKHRLTTCNKNLVIILQTFDKFRRIAASNVHQQRRFASLAQRWRGSLASYDIISREVVRQEMQRRWQPAVPTSHPAAHRLACSLERATCLYQSEIDVLWYSTSAINLSLPSERTREDKVEQNGRWFIFT